MEQRPENHISEEFKNILEGEKVESFDRSVLERALSNDKKGSNRIMKKRDLFKLLIDTIEKNA